MAEYIEQERLKEAFHADLQFLQSLDEHTMNLILIEIDEAPSADVAPVRHGRWIRQPSEIPGLDVEFCSECGQGINERNQFWNAKYCPNCGALMDGKGDEDEVSE